MSYTACMPELPEVETIRRTIEPLVLGKTILGIRLLDTSIAQGAPERVQNEPVGTTITAVNRRGKHLILMLDSGKGLVLHLRMTGSVLLEPPTRNPRVRAELLLSDDVRLYFNDMRRLGVMELIDDLGSRMKKMGPEPLSDEFTPEALQSRLAHHKIPIKAALLDQHIIAGIGNMYADEALFLARLHPMTPCESLSPEQVAVLWSAVRRVLELAIANQGASIDTYVLPGGERGTAYDCFNVAHKKGAPCPRCGTPLERLMVRKRGAYYCPVCQRPDKPQNSEA